MWLSGLSRDLIASHVGIGCGSVSRIIDDIRSKEIPDLDVLRTTATEIKSEGFDWKSVVSYIRFSNSLEEMGLSETDLEKLVLHIESHCFKTNQDLHKFIDALNKNFEFAEGMGVSIFEISDFIERKKEELQTLENELDKHRILVRKYKMDYQKIHGRLPDCL